MSADREIRDYLEIEFDTLRADETIPFSLYLFFSQNNHILRWRENGTRLEGEFLERYRARGLAHAWVHRSEAALYERYLHPEMAEAAEPAESVKPAAAPAPKKPAAAQPAAPKRAPTPEGARIKAAIADPALPEAEKIEAVAAVAARVAAQVAQAKSIAEQKEANHQARKVVEDVLAKTLDETESLLAEIWRLANIEPDLEHAVTVATYSVLFAMAFGKIDQNLLADLALAGVLHDVGLTQIRTDIATRPWKSFDAASVADYSRHVDASLSLITEYASDVPERVRVIIGQHHEKFDGTGYPQGLQGFRVDDVAQLLGMADMLDSISSGQWDGEPRTLSATLETLEKTERSRTFPEHFNPEVFAAVLRWTKTEEFRASGAEAAAVVRDKAQKVVKS